jgi:predicted nucleic-acid-binding protein
VIGLDTNVLLRFLLNDDTAQGQRAEATLRRRCTPDDPGFINHIVLCELAWVLGARYGYSRNDLADAIEALCASESVHVDAAPLVELALRHYRASRADFADCLLALLNRAAGCETTLTFDRAAASLPEFSAL